LDKVENGLAEAHNYISFIGQLAQAFASLRG